MLGVRFSLFSKIMMWFFLNLLLLGAVFLLFFNLDFRFERNSPIFAASNRLENISRAVTNETQGKTRAERDEILGKYSERYKVEFFVFDDNANQISGREITLPPEVVKRFSNPVPGANQPPNGNPPVRPNFEPPPPMQGPMFFVKSENPSLYWSSSPIFIFEKTDAPPIRARFIASSDSMFGGGLFFNPVPWLITIGIVVLVSTLFWFPFVRSLTRNIAQMQGAAEKIADEDFNVRLSEKRTDELGYLGKTINLLAKRLSGFVGGQKRFLGDISHELNSPLARMQFALSILEDRVDEKNRAYVEDVKEEVELMSKLVGELLTYSKAGIKAAHVELEKISLRPLVERVVEREKANETAVVKISVDEKLEVLAQPELLSRAIDNVVRNAIRYAGNAGEIKIVASNGNGLVEIKIADQGAGVPDNAIEKLFDPFYRVESHRSRETGGTGLGLAIVKTCVEACQGKVSADNLTPHGFEITILLKN